MGGEQEGQDTELGDDWRWPVLKPRKAAPPKRVERIPVDPTYGDPDLPALRQLIAHGDLPALEEHLLGLDPVWTEHYAHHLAPELRLDLCSRWVARRPESSLAWTVLGIRLVNAAWEIRGSGWASSVPRDAWPRFYALLEEAEDAMLRATRLEPTDPVPWTELTWCAVALPQRDIFDVMGRYQESLRRHPAMPVQHWQMGEALQPKWCGSWPELHDFANRVARDAPDAAATLSVVPLAHLNTWKETKADAAYFGPQEVAAIDAAADRSVFHPAFVDSPVTVSALNDFAACFFVIGDVDRYRPLLERIGDHLTRFPWARLRGGAEEAFARARHRAGLAEVETPPGFSPPRRVPVAAPSTSIADGPAASPPFAAELAAVKDAHTARDWDRVIDLAPPLIEQLGAAGALGQRAHCEALYGSALVNADRLEEGIAVLDRTLYVWAGEETPEAVKFRSIAASQLIMAAFRAGRYELAVHTCELAIEIGAPRQKAFGYRMMGMGQWAAGAPLDDVLQSLRQSVEVEGLQKPWQDEAQLRARAYRCQLLCEVGDADRAWAEAFDLSRFLQDQPVPSTPAAMLDSSGILRFIAWAAAMAGETDAAWSFYGQAERLWVSAGSPDTGYAEGMLTRSRVMRWSGEWHQADLAAEDAVLRGRLSGARWAVASGLRDLGRSASGRGDADGARRLLLESLAIFTELGRPREIAWVEAELAAVEDR